MEDDFGFDLDHYGPAEPVPFYCVRRLHRSGSVHRLYTTSVPERSRALDRLGYEPDGVACRLFGRSTPGAVPLYRLWHPPSWQHSLTVRDDNLQEALARASYRLEGVSGYAFATDRHPGTVPLWALHHRPTNAHLYTADPEERAAALAAGYESLGVACWVFPLEDADRGGPAR